MSFLEKIGAGVITAPFIAVIIAVAQLILSLPRIWAVITLWGWYVTPKYGYQPPPALTLFGLMTLYSVFTYRSQVDPKEAAQTTGQQVFSALLHPIISVGLGWLALRVF